MRARLVVGLLLVAVALLGIGLAADIAQGCESYTSACQYCDSDYYYTQDSGYCMIRSWTCIGTAAEATSTAIETSGLRPAAVMACAPTAAGT